MNPGIPDSPLKRQSDIAQQLEDIHILPKDICHLIGQYEYHLEGKCKSISDSYQCHGVLSDQRLVCKPQYDNNVY